MTTAWYGAIISLVGMAGFGLYAVVIWLGARFGWLDTDAPVGWLGCTWILACAGCILTGALVVYGGQR